MTEGRIRHLPVVGDDRLVGIVSIGDVVKSRIDELATQAESLERYVTGSAY
jgi:CBS domain-containing protein